MGIEDQVVKNNTDSLQVSNNESESKVVPSLLPYTLASKGWKTFGLYEGMLLENPNVKGKLIRTRSLQTAGEKRRNNLEESAKNYQIFKDTVEEARKHGVRFTSLEILFGKETEDRAECAFLVVDRVYGKPLGEIGPKQISEELINQVAEYCKSVAEYVQNCFQSSFWLQDISLDQLMWGHIMGKKENHLYNVDLEISTMMDVKRIKKQDKEYGGQGDTNLTIARLELRRIIAQLDDLEKKWGVDFSGARRAIIDSYKILTKGKEPKGDMRARPVLVSDFIFPEDVE